MTQNLLQGYSNKNLTSLNDILKLQLFGMLKLICSSRQQPVPTSSCQHKHTFVLSIWSVPIERYNPFFYFEAYLFRKNVVIHPVAVLQEYLWFTLTLIAFYLIISIKKWSCKTSRIYPQTFPTKIIILLRKFPYKHTHTHLGFRNFPQHEEQMLCDLNTWKCSLYRMAIVVSFFTKYTKIANIQVEQRHTDQANLYR